MPEGHIILMQAALYVACAPKSNSVVAAVGSSAACVEETSTTVPTHLQDAHYKGAKNLGRGVGYKYPHDYPGHYVPQQYLPEEIKDARFYEPSDSGYEKKIKEHLENNKKRSS